jgi:cytosine/adenosine deaminase-related metal-dependent hydrolase
MEPILLEHALILTCDEQNRVIRDGALLTQGSEISYVGSTDRIGQKRTRGATKIDAKGRLLLPGLIDTHVHLAQALLRGLVPDNVSLIEWLRDWVWPLQGVYDHEDGRISAELCILEMLRTGTTTFLESGLHTRYGFDGIADIVNRSGIRGILSKKVMDTPGYASKSSIMPPGMMEERYECVSEFKRMHKKWSNGAGGRIRVWLGPRTPGACSDSLYREIAELATEMRSGITMHLAEVQADIKYFRGRRTTPSNFVKKLGMLRAKSVFAHGVWITEEDMDVFAKYGASVAHCPSSNLKLGSGVAPVSIMLKRGMNVGLGCDGGPSNDCYDLVREMKLAAILQKGFFHDPESLSAAQTIRLATVNGARALGQENELGTLEVGKKADFILIGSENVHTHPKINPISNLVYSSTGHDVSMVVIDGKVIVENGVVLTMDKERILREAERRAQRVYQKAGK